MSGEENKDKIIEEKGNVTPFSAEMVSGAVRGSGEENEENIVGEKGNVTPFSAEMVSGAVRGSGEENEENIVGEKGNVTPVSAEMDPGAVQGRGSASPNEAVEERGKQLVVYDPQENQTEQQVQRIQSQPPRSSRKRPPCPSIGAFTVQCAKCFQWRLMPTMQKYEEIRENILQNPFYCEAAREWNPNVSCDVAGDINQEDETRLWAIDHPNISRPPNGWQRLLRIRGEGGTKFADVYYVAPNGKKFRSFKEIKKFLNENPEYIREGVNKDHFSFAVPKPLREDYTKKRQARVIEANTEMAEEASPLAWIAPEDQPPLQLGNATETNNSHDSPSKKQKTSKL